MAVARYYDESKNPDGAHFGGVPLRDLTEEEFEALPAWQQAEIDASEMYRKTNPKPTPRKSAASDEKSRNDAAEKEN